MSFARPVLVLLVAAALGACAPRAPRVPLASIGASGLYPGESPEMHRLIRASAAELGVPEALLHKVIQRESGYNPAARNGPYYGLMQILPETAETMGYVGPASGLLDAATNLRWAGAYLRGAWIVSDGDMDEAVHWYAVGYYYEARDRCLLVETGLRDHEVKC